MHDLVQIIIFVVLGNFAVNYLRGSSMKAVYLYLATAGAVMFFTAYYAMYVVAIIVDRLHFPH